MFLRRETAQLMAWWNALFVSFALHVFTLCHLDRGLFEYLQYKRMGASANTNFAHTSM